MSNSKQLSEAQESKNLNFLPVHFQLPLRFKRSFGIALTSLVLIILLFVVPALTQQPVTITVLMGAPVTPTWKPLIPEFEKKNPDIRINIVEGPNASNLIEDLYTSAFLLGSSPYDLVYMDIAWVAKFAAAGWLMDVSDKLSKEEQADFLQGDLAGGRYRGKLYRIPALSDAGMLYYRKDLLEQAGLKPPETFAELMQISQALQKQKKVRWGYLWQGRQYEGTPAMFVEVLKGYGGFWINPETREVGLDKPEAIQAVKFLLNTIAEGVSPPGVTTYQEEETRRVFQSGDAVFLRNWPYVWSLANANDSLVKGKIGLKPMVHARGESSGACQGGWGWGIAKGTQHPEAVWRAIQFFSSTEAQREIALDKGYLPSRRSVFNDAQIVEKYNHFPAVLKVLENAALRPPIAQYAQASDILQRYLSASFTGQLTPEQAMQAAANETRRLLGI
ncbi:MAG TPA: ABC transporter substrate-binding protein [Oculatellaceae cyanobacterium]|jgi:multiple sugar transport system substrate-binding protein